MRRARFLLLAAFLIAAALPAQAIEVKRVTSPGGLEAWLVEDHTNPIIALRFAFRGGASLDPAGKEGLARLASSLLDEGAGDLDSQAFQGQLEDNSISLGFDAGRDRFGGTLRTLTERRDKAFGLLALALTKPRFDAEPIARIKSQVLAGLRRDSEEPNVIASKTFFKALYPDHPYGRPSKGTPESVTAVTADDLRAFVRDRLARGTLKVGIVGDITPAQLGPLLDKTFGGLPQKATPWQAVETKPLAQGGTFVIKKPIPQSAILFGHGGMKRNHPDFYAATVMNYVLGGGGFTSRLYDEVREKRGLAYSISSGLYPLDFSALILGSAGTTNGSAGKTLEIVRREWQRMADTGLTAAELKDAKTYMTGSFPLRFSSSGRIASILVGMQTEDLGIDYLDKRNSYIEAVTQDDVNRVAKKMLNPKALTVVVVGQPEGVAATR